MSGKKKTILYITAIVVFAAISGAALWLHYFLPGGVSNALVDYIRTDKGFFVVFVPAAVLLLICLYKFIVYTSQKRIKNRVFKVDDDYNEDFRYAVGSFLKNQNRSINNAAKKSLHAAVRSTNELKDTSGIVSEALKENGEFVRYAVDRSVKENRKAVKRLRKEAKPLADKLAEKYKKK